MAQVAGVVVASVQQCGLIDAPPLAFARLGGYS
jgi:hypothetical protein